MYSGEERRGRRSGIRPKLAFRFFTSHPVCHPRIMVLSTRLLEWLWWYLKICEHNFLSHHILGLCSYMRTVNHRRIFLIDLRAYPPVPRRHIYEGEIEWSWRANDPHANLSVITYLNFPSIAVKRMLIEIPVSHSIYPNCVRIIKGTHKTCKKYSTATRSPWVPNHSVRFMLS